MNSKFPIARKPDITYNPATVASRFVSVARIITFILIKTESGPWAMQVARKASYFDCRNNTLLTSWSTIYLSFSYLAILIFSLLQIFPYSLMILLSSQII